MQLLLAEDERAMAEAVTAYLSYQGHTVDWAENGLDALRRAREKTYDALILDLMMPGLDGMGVLRTLREEGRDVPVLILTARSEVRDKVQGFVAGADDYLTKPFAMEELLVRLGAITRRGLREAPRAGTRFADLELNADTCTLCAGGEACPLSRREYQLMELLMRSPRVYFTADMLLDRVWGTEAEVDQGSVWVYISFLRRKLEKMHARARIASKRGIGYALEEKP